MKTMRRYNPDGYEISRARYRELSALCLQYNELKCKLNGCYGLSNRILSDSPRAESRVSVVERSGERAIKIRETIELIENTVDEACKGNEILSKFLLANVTQAIPYEHLNNPPCGRRQFYTLRRRFFNLLDEKR